MSWQDTVMGDEHLESVYQEEYKRAIKFSEEYATVLSAKNYNPNRPADRQRTFNTSHRDTVARAIAKAQAEITWGKCTEQTEGLFATIEAMYPELRQVYWKSKGWQSFKDSFLKGD